MCDRIDAIHFICVILEEAVPMNSGHQVQSRVVEVVHYVQLEVVALYKFVRMNYD